MGTSQRFLIVEDEPGIGRHLARVIRRNNGDPVITRSAAEAETVLSADGRWAGFIIDVGLPDGSGLDVLGRARVKNPGTPALILTGSVEREHINLAFDLNAHYVVKPPDADRLQRFFDETASFDERLERMAKVWQEKYNLSDSELDILVRASSGEQRDAIAQARDSSKLTIKKHVANLLKKTDDASLLAAAQRLLRAVAGS